MSARDAYPAVASLAGNGTFGGDECTAALDEIDRLRHELEAHKECERRTLALLATVLDERDALIARRDEVMRLCDETVAKLTRQLVHREAWQGEECPCDEGEGCPL